MNKLMFVMTLAVVAVLAAVRPEAQGVAAPVAVVDSQWLILQHPGGALARELQELAQEELLPIVQELDDLQARARAGEELSAEQVDRFELLQVSFEHAQSAWRRDIEAAVAPAVEAVDAAIETVAKEFSFSVVFDVTASSSSGTGLIVYIDPSVDITETALAELQTQ
jgi:Skp family chaperone for outer membrane proteins